MYAQSFRQWFFLVPMLLVLRLVSGEAATYIVDQDSRGGSCSGSNPGTVSQPVCNVDQGIALMNPGDTLYLREANYGSWGFGQGFPLPPPSGSSWATATTIASYPGERATFQNGGISMIGDVHYVIYDRLFMYNGGLYLDPGSHHIRFQNGLISSEEVGYNIVQGNGSFLEVLNSELFGAQGCHTGTSGGGCSPGSEGSFYAVYWRGSDSIFDGNIIRDNAGYGIHIFKSGADTTARNIVRNNVFYGNGFDDYPRSNGNPALIIGTGPDNKAYNNIVFNNYGGIQVDYRCHNCEVYNNTVYNSTIYGLAVNGSDNVVFRNNLLYNNGGGDLILDVPATAIGNWISSDGDPKFVNAGGNNFHLQSDSPAKNSRTCAPNEGASTDFKNVLWPNSPGLPRPQSPTPPSSTPCEPGAYEFQEGTPPPPTCPPDCPTDETPTAAAVIVSNGGHGDTPSDANGCRTAETAATPKATISSALACMTVPSKKLWLRGGNHAGFVDTGTTPITGGPNWSAPTILESYPTEGAVLQLPATNTGATLFFRAITDRYIHVRNLTLDGMSRTAAAGGGDGILIYGDSQFLRFENLTVRNDRYQNVVIIGASNIEVLTSTLTNALNNPNIRTYYEVHNLLFSGNTITTSPVAGIQLTDGAAQTDNVKIAKNTISGSATGIDVGVSTGVVIQNNVIQGEPGNGIYLRSGAVGWQVYHNTVVSNTGTGLLCDAGATSGDFANNIAVANTAAQLVNNCAAQNRGNTLTGTLAQIFTTVPVLKESPPASPAINSGVNLPSVTDDQIGNARPFGTFWDAGAREAQVAGPPPVVPHVSVRVFMFF